MKTSTIALFLTLTIAALSGCAKNQDSQPSPIVQESRQTVVSTKRPSANLAVATTQELKVTNVVNKDALLSQEFLYGADLQYSSFYDKDMDLYNQSLAIGHIPVRFRIVGQELQLIADDRRLYPSAVNHPEELISRFKILAQTDTTLTISGADSGKFLGTVFEGTHTNTQGALNNPAGLPPRDLWIRSFDFVADGNYLLQQTSVILADGNKAEFMESIFPRSTLNPGAQFEKFQMDPENPIGGDSDVLTRFRLLGGEPIRDGETKLTFAQHFDISKTAQNAEGTIDWYVTSDISDDEIQPVKLAVEGWNRYFKKFKGVERDVVRFKGRLPKGVYLGDPRYNVINWDTRRIAGAAYETQATDPETGKQSHSLIYMPAAWLQIGLDYWNMGQFSDRKNESVSRATLAEHGGAFDSARLSCLRDMRDAGLIAASGRLSADEVKEFGIRLLKGTLFHEVGHALGLAHNFKGSLSFDRSKPGSMFSTSIMDYNDYEIERAAFTEVGSSAGPLLEYDRQALSAIYNKSADIAASDAVLPACNDNEADNEDGGVDPLCIRYDIENDPTLSIGTALDRVQLATKTGDVTLAESLLRVPALVLTSDALAAVKTESDLHALAKKTGNAMKASMQFYFSGGKASLARVVKTNVKSLFPFADKVLPDGYSEVAMRDRAFQGVLKSLAMNSFSAPVVASVTKAEADAVAMLAKTPYMQGLAGEEGRKLSQNLSVTIDKVVQSFLTDELKGLPKLRSSVLAALVRHKKVPYFFGKVGTGQPLDIEASISGILGDAITADPNRTKSERLTAAATLATFAGRPQGDAAIAAVQAALTKVRAAAADNDSRELVESLLNALLNQKVGAT